MSYNNGPKIVTDGLVLCLDAGNTKSYPSSGTSWSDLSGNNNNGTLTNGPTFTGSFGGSIVFDNTNDYAPIGTSGFPFGSSAGTLSSWARTNTIVGGPGVFHWTITYGTSTIGQSRFIGINGTDYYFGGYGDDITATGVPLNTWVHMTGVYTGTTAYLYVNGSLVSGPTAKSWNTVANSAQIGRMTNGSEYWSGDIAHVSVYNRALSSSEVLQNYNANKGRFAL